MTGFVTFNWNHGTRSISFASGIPQTQPFISTRRTCWKRVDEIDITRLSRETTSTGSWWKFYYKYVVQRYSPATTTPYMAVSLRLAGTPTATVRRPLWTSERACGAGLRGGWRSCTGTGGPRITR